LKSTNFALCWKAAIATMALNSYWSEKRVSGPTLLHYPAATPPHSATPWFALLVESSQRVLVVGSDEKRMEVVDADCCGWKNLLRVGKWQRFFVS
jgi:hypothetical protein